jgi:hypothetical protein
MKLFVICLLRTASAFRRSTPIKSPVMHLVTRNRHLSLPQTIGCPNPRECRTCNAGFVGCSLTRWHQESSADTFDTDAVPPGAPDCFLVSVPCVLDIGYFSRRQGGCKGTTTSATLSPGSKSFATG